MPLNKTLCIFLLGLVSSSAGTSPYTENEIQSVEKLRDLVKDDLYQPYMRSDHWLVRWIRDQNGNIEKAKAKLLRSLKWRKDNKVDTILQEDFSQIINNCPFDLNGRDVAGRPILTATLGQCQLRKISLSGNRGKLNRAIVYLLEKAVTLGRETQKEDEGPKQGIIIADFSGFSLREHTCLACIPFFTALFEVYTQHYPEFVKSIYMINVPKVALSLSNVLLPFAPPNQRELIYVFGYDRKEWQTELLKIAPPDQLTKRYGGKRMTPNARQ